MKQTHARKRSGKGDAEPTTHTILSNWCSGTKPCGVACGVPCGSGKKQLEEYNEYSEGEAKLQGPLLFYGDFEVIPGGQVRLEMQGGSQFDLDSLNIRKLESWYRPWSSPSRSTTIAAAPMSFIILSNLCERGDEKSFVGTCKENQRGRHHFPQICRFEERSPGNTTFGDKFKSVQWVDFIAVNMKP